MKIPASGLLTGRAIEEWRGKTADTAIPKKVKDRLFLRFEGKDAVNGAKLRKSWAVDHIIPLKDWIPSPEYPHGNVEHNMQPINAEKHTEKTAKENKVRAAATAVRMKHNNITPPPAKPIPSRPFVSRLKPDDKATRIASGHQKHLERMAAKSGQL